ncbi:hypothetical protein ACLOJK_031357 [Asimina triloba]
MDESIRESLVCWRAEHITSTGIFNFANPLKYALPLLALQLVVVNVVTRLLNVLLRPLKQPRVVSEIMGGIIVGPSVLGRIEVFRNNVFPEEGKMVLDTVGMVALMFTCFLIGLKTDIAMARRAGRKALFISMLSLCLPLIATGCISLAVRPNLHTELRGSFVLAFFTSVMSFSSFAVLVPILGDLKLLRSELGRLAIVSSIISDCFGLALMFTFIVLKASTYAPVYALGAFVSIPTLVAGLFFLLRPIAFWINRRTPAGDRVKDTYIFFFLMMVVVVAFLSETLGANTFNGALVLGMAIPGGPPLGAALIDKLECFLSGLLLPAYYAGVGLKTDVFAIDDIEQLAYLQLIVVVSCLAKIFSVAVPSVYYNMPLRDAIAFGLLVNIKGITEVVTFKYWVDTKVLSDQSFAILIITCVLMTAVVTPLAQIFYEPSNNYASYSRRSIQHMSPDQGFAVLACIHNQDNVPTIINLLEATYLAVPGPRFAVSPLILTELVGRTIPKIISHTITNSQWHISSNDPSDSEHIINAFRNFLREHNDQPLVQPITAIAPYSTMHEDICSLALQKNALLILLPFHKKPRVDGGMETNRSVRVMNQRVLGNAPCSVGVLVDHAFSSSMQQAHSSDHFCHRIGVFFVGGEDDRETLALAACMSQHPRVYISIIRFLPLATIKAVTREKKLDNEALMSFKSRNVGNEERVVYKELVVSGIGEIVSEIKPIALDDYNLFMVGMRHELNSLFAEGLGEWVDCPELGIIGDMLASQDLVTAASVLVIRQQKHMNLGVMGHPSQESARIGDPIERYGILNFTLEDEAEGRIR